MNQPTIQSQKIKLGKKFIIAWSILAVLFVIIVIIARCQYAKYQKGQKAAIYAVMFTTDKFDKYDQTNKNDYKRMIEAMNSYLDPDYDSRTIIIDGVRVKYDNLEQIHAAEQLNQKLGTILTESGYPCYTATKYLKYANFTQFYLSEALWALVLWLIPVLIFLVKNLIYLHESKKTLIVDISSKRIICQKNKITVKEFPIQNVYAVQYLSSNPTKITKGIKITGKKISYKIKNIYNADELQQNIIALATIEKTKPVMTAASSTSYADELKKYKELLDAGAISLYEFEAIKKQLLDI